MSNGVPQADSNAALAMLSAFASVEARAFNLILTDIHGEKVEGTYRPNRSLEDMRRRIDRVLQDAARHRHNVIIRPRCSKATLIQLDDLDFAKAERIAPRAFIVFRTSPANYQAWVAVEPGAPPEFRRRLIKGIGGVDKTASGSTRIAGSLNFKPGYAPEFPRVEITHTNPGNVTSMAALEQAGFAAPEEPPPARSTLSPRAARYASRGWRKWPSYEMCLVKAPESKSRPGNPRRSLADFTWCRTAIEWGWSVEATASHLMEVSTKAQENGPRYAMQTAVRAAESVERQPYRERSEPRPA